MSVQVMIREREKVTIPWENGADNDNVLVADFSLVDLGKNLRRKSKK